MRFVALVIVVTLLAMVAIFSWTNFRIAKFTVACAVQNGHVQNVGNSMSSYICVSGDGRIIEIPGP